MRLTSRLLILSFVSVLLPMIGLSLFLKSDITENILEEKRDKLFGLARQLDRHLDGGFDDILREKGALGEPRSRQIEVLNAALRDITDFVASGNEGVGVGYYHRALDAVLTYGPSSELEYTVGQSIFPGHQGYEVMDTGKPMVQTGHLVRGNILNCMWPINRAGETIGYIWSNETLDKIGEQLDPVIRRVYLINVLIFVLIFTSVMLTTKTLLDKIMRIKKGIEVLFHSPNSHVPEISGELSVIVRTINELVDNMNLIKCYNKNILESVRNGVLAVALDGSVTRANKAFVELFPGLGGSSIDRGYREVFGPEMQRVIEDIMADPALHSGEEVESGGRILEVYGNAMIDEAGARQGTVFVFRDVTLERRYEGELKEKERAATLGEMALGVVHEMKNPLTSVKGFAQLLRHPGVTETARKKYIGLIDTELNRVNRLLNELLIFGGRSRIEPRARDILPLVRDAVDRNDWGGLDPRPSVRTLGGPAFPVRVDEFKAGQVLDNILKNALEAVVAKGFGRIAILIDKPDSSVRLRIVDGGTGIRAEDMGKIGTPLFTTKPNGTGFGLAISRKIMEAHGGSLAVDSRFGFHTTVSLLFPRAEERIEAKG